MATPAEKKRGARALGEDDGFLVAQGNLVVSGEKYYYEKEGLTLKIAKYGPNGGDCGCIYVADKEAADFFAMCSLLLRWWENECGRGRE